MLGVLSKSQGIAKKTWNCIKKKGKSTGIIIKSSNHAKCYSRNIKRIGWIWAKITTFAAEILNKLITRLL